MKKIVSMVAGLAAGSLFAAVAPSVQEISFTVQGDKYADGTAVLDGECYALVWSADGQFDGINVDGSAKDKNDKVLYVGSFEKGQSVTFQIEDGAFTDGLFDIWVLDTRKFENGEVKSVGKVGNAVVATSAAKATETAIAVASSANAVPGTKAEGVVGGAVVSGATIDKSSIPALKFTSIKVDGDWVVMEAEGSVPGVNYVTKNANGDEGSISSGNGGKITLIRPKKADGEIIRGMVK